MTDSELVRCLRERDPVAVRRVVDYYLPSVWRYVCARLDGNRHISEDIVSECLLALLRAIEADVEIASVGGWLRSVAGNKVNDHFRAAARVRHLMEQARRDGEVVETTEDPVEKSLVEEHRTEIRQVMDELNERQRMALEWKYLDKLSVRQIAERWHKTEKTVESILFRARQDFRRLYEKKRASTAATPRNGNHEAARKLVLKTEHEGTVT